MVPTVALLRVKFFAVRSFPSFMGFLPVRTLAELWNGAVVLGLSAGTAYLLYSLWTAPSPAPSLSAEPTVCPISGKSGGKCPIASMGCFQSKDEAPAVTQVERLESAFKWIVLLGIVVVPVA